VPIQIYNEQSETTNGGVLSGELVLGGAPWNLSGINSSPPLSYTILIRGSRSSSADIDNYIIRREDLILAPGTLLQDYAVDISLNGRTAGSTTSFNSGTQPFDAPPSLFGNYGVLTGLSIAGSNYLRYTISGSTFFGITVKDNNAFVGDYTLELSLVYVPTAALIPKLSVFNSSVSVQNEGNSGSTNYVFTIHRTGLTNGVTSVNWAVAGAGSNPTTTNDFVPGSPLSGVLTFAPTETEKTVTVQVAGDTTFEPDEAFDLILSGATSGAEILRASQRAVITNDDAPPPPATLAIAAADAFRAEGTGSTPTPFTFTVSRSGDTSSPSSAVWTVAGSGANPATASDFTGNALPTGTVSFAAGQSSATVTVGVNPDSTIENDETFTVTLSNPSGASLSTATASGIIRNDDVSPPPPAPPTLAITPVSADKAEGTGGTSTPFTFTVSRSGNTSSPSSASWDVAGSGTNPATALDFTGNALPTGTVSFAVGQSSATITVAVNPDSTVESDEPFTVTLANPSGASLSTATASGIIRNDDVAPPPPTPTAQSTVAIVATTNGSEAGSIPSLFTITRTGDLSSSLSVPWSRSGTAVFGIDFNGPTFGVIVFPAGSAVATLSIPTLDDTFRDPGETLTITLTPPAGTTVTPGGSLSATAIQVDDDTIAPVVTPPVVTTVVFGGHDGRLALGEAITLTVTFSNTVVAGTGVNLPSILLNSGGRAAYVSGSGTTQLIFRYVPASGETTSDLATSAANALAGVLLDLTGNAVAPSGFNNRRPTGPVLVDTLAPSVVGFAFSRNSGILALGASLTFTITFSENVVVSGSAASLPSLLLNNGGRASYVSGSGTSQLVFSYIPVAGQSIPALTTASANALSGLIRDQAGNAVGSAGFNNRRPSGTLRVDALAPRVTGCAYSRNSGVLAAGTSLFFTITFSETVFVSGSGASLPSILLNSGGRASYVSGSGSTKLIFKTTIAKGQFSSALATASANALSGFIRDQAGNAVVASGFNNRRPSGTLRVDTLAPSVTGFAFSRNSGVLALGEALVLTITFSENVVVSGSGANRPSLLLNSGGRAFYVSGSGSSQLVFRYVPAAGENTSALATTASNALSGLIRDLFGNAVVASGFNNRTSTGSLGVDTRPRLLTIAQTRDGDEQGTVAAVFTLSKTGPRTSPLTVAYTLGGTATPGDDHSGAITGTVTFPVGSNTTTLSIPIADDAQVEGQEVIIARLTAPAGYSLVPGFERADALLIDNDPLTGLGGSLGTPAHVPLQANLSPLAAPTPLAASMPAPPLHQTPSWDGGTVMEPMQAASPLAILRVAEPHA